MARKNFTAEKITNKLCEAEVLMSQGQPLGMVGVSPTRDQRTGPLTLTHRIRQFAHRPSTMLAQVGGRLGARQSMLQETLAGKNKPRRHGVTQLVPCSPSLACPSDACVGRSNNRAPVSAIAKR